MRFISTLAVVIGVSSLGNAGETADRLKILSTGEWSKPVADDRGYALRGRLVLGEKPPRDELREVVVYVELQDASDFVGQSMRVFCEMGKRDFSPEYTRGLKCVMHDKEKRPITSSGYPFGGAVPLSEWIKLPVDATIRVRTTPFGIRRAKSLAISPYLNSLWVIGDEDPKEYFLSGTFTVNPDDNQIPPGEEHVWRGTIVLPSVTIVNKQP